MRHVRHLFLLVVATGVRPAVAQERGPLVRPGIDVLMEDSLHLVRGRTVGLVTNRTGVDRHGVSDVERLRSGGIVLAAIFTPEHGYRGAAAPGEAVASSHDSATGLPIYSLYGASYAPTQAMLQGIDVMVVDLQDVGARYYTYIFTTIEVMWAAATAGIPVVVLDRPNPIGGAVQGNVLDPATRSMVGSLDVPMRHGLTLGEQARVAREQLGLMADLRVVPVQGWHRHMYFDQTGLPFVSPSPNLQSLESLIHYPGSCLFEGTNLSVGRGTGEAFSQVGAPWLDTRAVIRRMGRQPGVELTPVAFTPRRPGDGKFADTLLQGIRFRVTDRAAYDPTATALRLLVAIRAVHPNQFAWIPRHFDRLVGEPGLRERLDQGVSVDSVMAVWKTQRLAFEPQWDRVRIYPD